MFRGAHLVSVKPRAVVAIIPRVKLKFHKSNCASSIYHWWIKLVKTQIPRLQQVIHRWLSHRTYTRACVSSIGYTHHLRFFNWVYPPPVSSIGYTHHLRFFNWVYPPPAFLQLGIPARPVLSLPPPQKKFKTPIYTPAPRVMRAE